MLIGIFLVQILNFVPVDYLNVLRALAPIFGSLALVVIMFNGSGDLKFESSLIKNWKGVALGILDNLISLVLLSLFMYYAFQWPPIYGAILGIILGETSSIVVIPFIRKVKISADLFKTLFIESTLNSIVAILMFSLAIVLVTNQSFSVLSFTTYILDYISLAVVIGIVAGIGWLFVLNSLKSAREYLATIAVAILLYGLVDIFNGSAIITVMIFGMIIGNRKFFAKALKLDMDFNPNKEKVVEKELEFLISTFFFVFMGMITVLSVQYAIYGLVVALLLILVRYPEVALVLKRSTKQERGLVFSLMPRGVTVATLATIAYGMGGQYFTQTFYISFFVIAITSIVSSILLNKVKVEVKK
jgi:cell volume regulation protein A